MKVSANNYREKKDRLVEVARSRNMAEYLSGGTAALIMFALAAKNLIGGETSADRLLAVGFVLLALGILFAGLHLWRQSGRARSECTESGGDKNDDAEQIRNWLRRERLLLGSAWRWYVVPLVPGMVLIHLAIAMASPSGFRSVQVSAALAVAALALVIVLNHRAARRIDDKIESFERNMADPSAKQGT